MSGAAMSSSVTQHTAVDPTEAEEEVMKGRLTFGLTAHKEVGGWDQWLEGKVSKVLF